MGGWWGYKIWNVVKDMMNMIYQLIGLIKFWNVDVVIKKGKLFLILLLGIDIGVLGCGKDFLVWIDIMIVVIINFKKESMMFISILWDM